MDYTAEVASLGKQFSVSVCLFRHPSSALWRKCPKGEDWCSQISELHGNCFKEVCQTCGAEYLRQFDVTIHREGAAAAYRRGYTHLTGRQCTERGCGGPLMDSIINFGESLPQEALELGMLHSRKVSG